jgi:CRP-like cAMP-binding protein
MRLAKVVISMADAFSPTHTTGNVFLDKMPAAARAALHPHLQHVSLKHTREIYAAGEPMDALFFPIHSIISVVADLREGETVEIGIVGREGMSGHTVALGQSIARHRSNVQVGDSAECISADHFRAALQSEPELQAYVERYAYATTIALAQSVACNSHHPANERCARWLLMAHDRVEGDVVLLTQEFLGQMLGVRRGSVTIAASALQEAGFISYSRGHISIRNRSGLESASCECYDTVEHELKGIMGYSISKTADMDADARVVTKRPDGSASPSPDGRAGSTY